MNRAQWVVVSLAFLLAVGTYLFPPMEWTEVVPIANERGFVVDSHGIYHDEPGLIFHRGLRFVGRADDGRILWKALAAEWSVLAAIGACLICFCRSKQPKGHDRCGRSLP